MKNTSERLDFIRRKKGLSFNALADLIGGISGDAIRKAVGRNNIKPYYISTISDKLRVNEKWLLTGEGDMLASKEIKSDLKERIEILEDTVRLQDKKIEALRKFKDSQGDLLIGVEFYKNEVLELKELIHRKIGLRLDGSQKG